MSTVNKSCIVPIHRRWVWSKLAAKCSVNEQIELSTLEGCIVFDHLSMSGHEPFFTCAPLLKIQLTRHFVANAELKSTPAGEFWSSAKGHLAMRKNGCYEASENMSDNLTNLLTASVRTLLIRAKQWILEKISALVIFQVRKQRKTHLKLLQVDTIRKLRWLWRLWNWGMKPQRVCWQCWSDRWQGQKANPKILGEERASSTSILGWDWIGE